MPVEKTMRGLEDVTLNYEDSGRVPDPGDRGETQEQKPCKCDKLAGQTCDVCKQ